MSEEYIHLLNMTSLYMYILVVFTVVMLRMGFVMLCVFSGDRDARPAHEHQSSDPVISRLGFARVF